MRILILLLGWNKLLEFGLNRILFFLCSLCIAFCPQLSAQKDSAFARLQNNEKGITYTFSGGRLGDNILTYLHARWLSYKYDTLFIYAPFPYSDQLKMHECDELRIDLVRPFFKKEWILNNEKEVAGISGSALIFVRYFPESTIEIKTHPHYCQGRFTVDWKNPEFKQLMRKLIAPRFPITTLEMPNEPWITVAIHVRRGGNFDPSCIQFDLPLKAPPDSFYLTALRRMSELLSHRQIYAYIFTDDPDPQKIVHKYQDAVKDLVNIRFDCRKTFNGPWNNVLEDFFSIQKFDCLIRPDSNYTIVAEKLKDFQIVISPEDARIEKGAVYIDTLHIEKSF